VRRADLKVAQASLQYIVKMNCCSGPEFKRLCRNIKGNMGN